MNLIFQISSCINLESIKSIFFKSVFVLVILIAQLQHIFCQRDNDTSIPNLPYFSFGKGIGITAPDSNLQLNIRFRVQSRIGYFNQSGKPTFFEGQIRRLRLRFDGFILDPKYTYAVQLSFAPGDVGIIEDGENLNVIRDAVLFYTPSKTWNFGFGQTKLPGNRQRVNSSGALQLTDRSITNSRFNIDRDFGLFINYNNKLADNFFYNIKNAISTGDGRNFTRTPNNGLAYTSKIELMPFGKFKNDGIYFEGDLAREKSVKIMFSGVYHYNHKANRQGGQLGSTLFEERNLSSFIGDFLLKYQGFALMYTYINRYTSDPITRDDKNNTSVIYTGYGYDLQSSYVFKNDFEIIGRYSKLNPEKTIQNSSISLQDQYTFGLTKYMREHAYKLQLEATYDKFTFSNGIKDNFYLRFQIEFGI